MNHKGSEGQTDTNGKLWTSSFHFWTLHRASTASKLSNISKKKGKEIISLYLELSRASVGLSVIDTLLVWRTAITLVCFHVHYRNIICFRNSAYSVTFNIIQDKGNREEEINKNQLKKTNCFYICCYFETTIRSYKTSEYIFEIYRKFPTRSILKQENPTSSSGDTTS